MIEKKNIDRLFQEKFKDFEAVPDEKIWNNIELRLRKKKKRRVIPIWWTAAGVAALFVIGLLIWNAGSDKDGSNGTGIVDTDNSIPQPVQNNDGKDSIRIPNNTKHNILPSANQSDAIVSGDEQPSNPLERNAADSESSVNSTKKDKPSREKLLKDRYSVVKERNNAVAASDGTGKTNTGNTKATRYLRGSDNLTSVNKSKAVDDGIAVNTATKSETDPDQLKSGQNQGNDTRNIDPSQKNPIADSDTKSESDPVNSVIDPKSNNNSSNDGEIQIAEVDQKKQDTAKPAGPDSMEELLKEKETTVAVNERKVNRWHISSNVAPIYFSSVSNGSPLDPRFKDNPKAYKPSVSYGLGVQYNISKKLAVRSGVNAITLEYNTTDVLISQTPEARKLENVKPNARGTLIQVDNIPAAATMTMGRTISQFGGNLSQTTGYVEVPLEMTYKLLDRKFGIDVVGGVSTLFLNKNEVSVETSGAEVNIGEAENLNDVHFSTNVGVGFRYNFLKNFQATVEPVFKYQINTFTNDVGGFKPYFFGLYTGLNYRF